MNYMKAAIASVLLGQLAGCSISPPVYPRFTPLPFDAVEYAALPTTGTGVVRGQVFATTVGGDVKKGAGESVVMFPATKYGDQRYYEQVIHGKYAAVPEDSRYQLYVLKKTTDGDGRFEFRDVPPGKWYIVSNVRWSIFEPGSYGPVERKQGGSVSDTIYVRNGAVTDAILSY